MIVNSGALLYVGTKRIGHFKMGFTEAMTTESIAVKEARAIWYGIIHFKDKLKNSVCIFYCDNQSVCWAFHKQMSRCRKLNEFIIAIIRITKRLNIKFEIVWTPTLYQLADKPSREISLNEEFLPHAAFKELQRVAGFACTVDCMASDTNAKCSKYLKWRDDNIYYKNCIGIDFLMTDAKWLKKQKLFVFPPKNIMAKTADHLVEYYSATRFIFVFHQFDELPLAIVRLLSLNSTRQVLLSDKKAVTFIPSEKRVTLENPDGTTSVILGTPNIRPRLTKAIINDPFTSKWNRPRKRFRPSVVKSVKNNIK